MTTLKIDVQDTLTQLKLLIAFSLVPTPILISLKLLRLVFIRLFLSFFDQNFHG